MLRGEPAVRHSAEDAEHGVWSVHVVELHHLIYTVTLHHGPSAPDETREVLEKIVKNLRFLDRR